MRLFHPYFSIVKKRLDGRPIGYSIHVRIFTDSSKYDFVRATTSPYNPIISEQTSGLSGKLKFAGVKYQLKISKSKTGPWQNRQRTSILEHQFDVSQTAYNILTDSAKNKPYIHIELCDVESGVMECSDNGKTNHVSSSSGHHEDDED